MEVGFPRMKNERQELYQSWQTGKAALHQVLKNNREEQQQVFFGKKHRVRMPRLQS
jgi:hypothetical protein